MLCPEMKQEWVSQNALFATGQHRLNLRARTRVRIRPVSLSLSLSLCLCLCDRVAGAVIDCAAANAKHGFKNLFSFFLQVRFLLFQIP